MQKSISKWIVLAFVVLGVAISQGLGSDGDSPTANAPAQARDAHSERAGAAGAAAGVKAAEKQVEIQRFQNESDISSAETKLELARLDLKKYLEGDYIQEKNALKGQVEIASEELALARDTLAAAQRLSNGQTSKPAGLDAERFAVAKAQRNFERAAEKLKVLEDFGYQRQVIELKAHVADAERELKRVTLIAESALADANIKVARAKRIFEIVIESARVASESSNSKTTPAPTSSNMGAPTELVPAIKELREQIDALRAEIRELRKLLNADGRK